MFLCVFPSVCQFVSALTTKLFDIDIFGVGTGIDLDKISDEFDGQRHRLKVKVTRLKNVIFGQFYCLLLLCVTCYITLVFTMAP